MRGSTPTNHGETDWDPGGTYRWRASSYTGQSFPPRPPSSWLSYPDDRHWTADTRTQATDSPATILRRNLCNSIWLLIPLAHSLPPIVAALAGGGIRQGCAIGLSYYPTSEQILVTSQGFLPPPTGAHLKPAWPDLKQSAYDLPPSSTGLENLRTYSSFM